MYRFTPSWMDKFREGERGKDNFPHLCKYSLIRKSVRLIANKQSYLERCNCGRMRATYWSPYSEELKSPGMIRKWYDSDGNLQRITGDTDHLEAEEREIQAKPDVA